MQDIWVLVLAMAATGAFAGLIAGMFGIGGGNFAGSAPGDYDQYSLGLAMSF